MISRLGASDAHHVGASRNVSSVESIVEQLVRNALDAGASTVAISCDLTQFSLSVRDDGRGIASSDMPRVGEIACTSHDRAGSDLQRPHVYGFRGEALFSIALVCTLEVVSRAARESAPHVTVLRDGARIMCGIASGARGCGTTVTVRDLYFNRPVQRKVLMRNGAIPAVLERVRALVARIAVAHCAVAFSLRDASRGQLLLETRPCDNELATLKQLYRSPLALESFRRVDGECLPRVKVGGFACGLSEAHRTTELQLLYVNKRAVSRRDPLLKLVATVISRIVPPPASSTWPGARRAAGGSPRSLVEVEPLQPAFVLFVQVPADAVALHDDGAGVLAQLSDECAVQECLAAALVRSLARPASASPPLHRRAAPAAREQLTTPPMPCARVEEHAEEMRLERWACAQPPLVSKRQCCGGALPGDEVGRPLVSCAADADAVARARAALSGQRYARPRAGLELAVEHGEPSGSAAQRWAVQPRAARTLMLGSGVAQASEPTRARPSGIGLLAHSSDDEGNADSCEARRGVAAPAQRQPKPRTLQLEEAELGEAGLAGHQMTEWEAPPRARSSGPPSGPLALTHEQRTCPVKRARAALDFDAQARDERAADAVLLGRPSRRVVPAGFAQAQPQWRGGCELQPEPHPQPRPSATAVAMAAASAWVLQSSAAAPLPCAGSEAPAPSTQALPPDCGASEPARARQSFWETALLPAAASGRPPLARSRRQLGSARAPASSLPPALPSAREQPSEPARMFAQIELGGLGLAFPSLAFPSLAFPSLAFPSLAFPSLAGASLAPELGGDSAPSCAPAGGSELRRIELSASLSLAPGLFLAPAAQPGPARPQQVVITKAQLLAAQVVGQVDRKWIAVVLGASLALIDQHAADERVQLELLLAAHIDESGGPLGVESVPLEPPELMQLTAHETALLREHLRAVQTWGWRVRGDLAGTGDAGELMLVACPAVCSHVLRTRSLAEHLATLEELSGALVPPRALLRAIVSRACRSAIMFGRELSHAQCVEVVAQLARTKFPFQCAHGRPTIVPMLDLPPPPRL